MNGNVLMTLQERVGFLPVDHTDFILTVQWSDVAPALVLLLLALMFIWWRQRRRGKGSAV